MTIVALGMLELLKTCRTKFEPRSLRLGLCVLPTLASPANEEET